MPPSRGSPPGPTGPDGLDAPGTDIVNRPDGWGKDKPRYYLENHYHQPSDTLRSDHDLRGLAEDARLMFEAGRRIAGAPEMPQWKADAPFDALRDLGDEMMHEFRPESCLPDDTA